MTTANSFTFRPLPRLLPAGLGRIPPLHLALGLSFLLHVLLLLLHFSPAEWKRTAKEPTLDVVLVNSRSAQRPLDPQVLAQTSLDGGGNIDEPRRAKTPLPPSPKQQRGAELEQRLKMVHELESRQAQLLAKAQASTRKVVDNPPAPAADPAPPTPTPEVPKGRDLANMALAMARYEAEIARNIDEYNQRPRKKNIGVRAEEYRFARYVEDWRTKVERVGTLNYPAAAKGKFYGSLVMTVAISADGAVQQIEVHRSSGHKVLDDAARRIVQMAGPYAPFPPDIRRDTDVIEITRTWSFTRGDALETSAR